VKVAAEWRVYVLGATLCVALTICARNFGDRGGPHFMASLTLAGIAYLLAVRELFAKATFSRRLVVIGLVLAAVWHIEFLRLPPGADDDIHRYVWDGRLQRLGYNPYLVVPSDPAVKDLHTPETRNLNNPDLPSPYPAGAQLFFRAVTAIHESTFALKVAFVICEFAIVLLLLDLLRRRQGAHLVLAFAWNPLLAIEVAGSGHLDIVGALLLVVSAAALVRRWRMIAAVALGLAIAVKFLPIVLLPLYWKRVRIRDAALAVVVVGLMYVPFLNHGRIPMGSLGTYVQTFRFNGPVFAALNHFAPPQLLVGLAVLAGLVTATWMRIRVERNRASQGGLTTEDTESHRGGATLLPLSNFVIPMVHASEFAWPMAASLLCAPAVFPWYLLWLLPFLTSASTLLIVIWTVSIIPTYVQWHLRALGRPWGALPGWTMLLEYGCVAIAAATIALRRVRARQQSRLVETNLLDQPTTSASTNPGTSSNATSVQFTEEERS
jgi:alpha-1,6-mannosyltransferase